MHQSLTEKQPINRMLCFALCIMSTAIFQSPVYAGVDKSDKQFVCHVKRNGKIIPKAVFPEKAIIFAQSGDIRPMTFYRDFDGDGYAPEFAELPEDVVVACVNPEGYVLASEVFDCNDLNAEINPGAEEIPGNDIDENCDAIVETTTCPLQATERMAAEGPWGIPDTDTSQLCIVQSVMGQARMELTAAERSEPGSWRLIFPNPEGGRPNVGAQRVTSAEAVACSRLVNCVNLEVDARGDRSR